MLIKILESLKAKLQVALEPMTMQMYSTWEINAIL